MTDTAFGLVVLAPDMAADAVDGLAARLGPAMAPGGFLCLVWRVDGWLSQAAVLEARCIGAFVDRQGWAFFGNLAVRAYGQDPAVPAETLCVLLLKKPGPRLLDAAKALPAEARFRALLDTKAPAFTRDWANNVWHMRQDNLLGRVTARLAALLSLPGAPRLIEGVAGALPDAAAADFVPRIDKVAYGAATAAPAQAAPKGRIKRRDAPLPLFADR